MLKWSCLGKHVDCVGTHSLTTVQQESDLVEVVISKKVKDEDAPPASQESLPEITLRRNDFRSSTKLDALLQNLRMCHINLARPSVKGFLRATPGSRPVLPSSSLLAIYQLPGLDTGRSTTRASRVISIRRLHGYQEAQRKH